MDDRRSMISERPSRPDQDLGADPAAIRAALSATADRLRADRPSRPQAGPPMAPQSTDASSTSRLKPAVRQAGERRRLPAIRPIPQCARCADAGWFVADVCYEHPDFGKLIPCPVCKLVEQSRQRLLDGASGLEPRMRTWTFVNFDARVPGVADGLLAVRELADRIMEAQGRRRSGEPLTCERAIVTLWGAFGGGKTHLGAALVNACAREGVSALYSYAPDLWAYLGATTDRSDDVSYESRMVAVRGVDVLVLDEPGGLVDGSGEASVSPGAAQRRARLLDFRCRSGRPTLLLDNRHPDDWGAPQVADRLLDQDAAVCVLHTTPVSYRRMAPWERGEGKTA